MWWCWAILLLSVAETHLIGKGPEYDAPVVSNEFIQPTIAIDLPPILAGPGLRSFQYEYQSKFLDTVPPPLVFVDLFKHSLPFELYLSPDPLAIPFKPAHAFGDDARHIKFHTYKDGYPASFPTKEIDGFDGIAVTRVAFGRNGNYPGGQYMCIYDGDGVVEVGGDAQALVSPEDVVKNRFPIAVTPSNDGIEIRVLRTSKDNIRNIRLVQIEYLGSYMERPFREEFLEKYRSNYNILRFGNWMGPGWNVSQGECPRNVWTEWDSRPTVFSQTQADQRRGVAAEYWLIMMKELAMDGWVTLPQCATNKYVTSLAQAFHDHVPSSLRVWVEASNRVPAEPSTINHSAQRSVLFFQLWHQGFAPARPYESRGGLLLDHQDHSKDDDRQRWGFVLSCPVFVDGYFNILKPYLANGDVELLDDKIVVETDTVAMFRFVVLK